MPRLDSQEMFRIADAWANARRQFLQQVAYSLGIGAWSEEDPSEPMRPYAEAFDTAGAQVVAIMSGIAKPMQVLEAIARGAQESGWSAAEKAREAAYAAGMAAAGFPVPKKEDDES